MEIMPGIHRVDSIKLVNCYLGIEDDLMFIVDTGMPKNAKNILDYIIKSGKKPSDLKYIIITHADIDHAGCAAELKQVTGAKIAIHKLDAPILSGKEEFKLYSGPQPLRYFANHFLRSLTFTPITPDILLEQGASIGSWKIVHTPGHTHGSMCLFQKGRCLIAGDALRTSLRGKPRPISRRICLDLAEVRKSLFTISNLEYQVLLPGHGAPIMANASEIVRKMVISYENKGKL